MCIVKSLQLMANGCNPIAHVSKILRTQIFLLSQLYNIRIGYHRSRCSNLVYSQSFYCTLMEEALILKDAVQTIRKEWLWFLWFKSSFCEKACFRRRRLILYILFLFTNHFLIWWLWVFSQIVAERGEGYWQVFSFDTRGLFADRLIWW